MKISIPAMKLMKKFALLVSSVIALAFSITVTAALDAQQILQDTGIQGGLIVHLGCGDGKLTAALHANDA